MGDSTRDDALAAREDVAADTHHTNAKAVARGAIRDIARYDALAARQLISRIADGALTANVAADGTLWSPGSTAAQPACADSVQAFRRGAAIEPVVSEARAAGPRRVTVASSARTRSTGA